jgi:hypothetical protein
MNNGKTLAGTYKYDTSGAVYNTLVSVDGTQPPIELHVRTEYLVTDKTRYYIKLMFENQMHEINLHCDVLRLEYRDNPEKWEVGKTYRLMTFDRDPSNKNYCYLIHVEPEQVRIVRITQDKYTKLADDFTTLRKEHIEAIHGTPL